VPLFQENSLNGNLDTAVKLLYTTSKEPFIIGLSQSNRHLWEILVHYYVQCLWKGPRMEVEISREGYIFLNIVRVAIGQS